jgi:hypothetical protein
MNRSLKDIKQQRVTTIHGPHRAAGPVLSYHGQDADPLELLKRQLMSERLATVRDSELAQRLRRAAEESASIAWATTYPLLTLPELLREKVDEAFRQHQLQAKLRTPGRLAVSIAA